MGFYLSWHAAQRAKEMNLDPVFLAELVDHPHVSYQCPSRKDPSHLVWMLKRDGITAFADRRDDGDWDIITIVPGSEEKWREHYPEARDGREFREDKWWGKPQSSQFRDTRR